jgi:hypothetical protein
MINLRTRCIYALIVTSFLTAISIIEFVSRDNPLWRDLARFLLFPLLAALLAVFIIGTTFAPHIGDRHMQVAHMTGTQYDADSQTKYQLARTLEGDRKATFKTQQQKTPEKQTPRETTVIKGSYKSTNIEYEFSNTGTTNQTSADTGQGDEEEQAS